MHSGWLMLEPQNGELGELADEALIAASREGNERAFAELWRRHSGAALTVARRLAFSDAEDVVSEAFETVWEQLGRGIGPRQYFRAYVFTVVRNIAARQYRLRQRTVTGVEIEGAPVPGGDEIIALTENVHEVLEAFQTLPERWQLALWWLEVEGVSRGEVAQRFDLSPNAVSVLLRRAREGLRVAWLEKQLPPLADDEHRFALEALPRYVRRGLGNALRRDVAAHLRSCTSCAAAEAELQEENRRLGGKAGGSLLVLVLGIAAIDHAWRPTSALAAEAANDHHSAGGFGALFGAFPLRAMAWVAGVAVFIAVAGFVMWPRPEPTGDPQPPSSTDTRTGEASPSTPAPTVRRPSTGATGGGTPAPGAGSGAADDAPLPTKPGPVPTTPAPPQGGSGTFTLVAADGAGGGLAPIVSGRSAPGSPVVLSVGGIGYSVDASPEGVWSSDLSTLDLPAGTYEVSARPSASGWSPEVLTAGFVVAVPGMSARLSPSAAQAGGPGEANVSISGLPSREVCVILGPGVYQRFALDASGAASGTVPLTDSNRSAVSFRYCSGSRFGAIASSPVR